MKRIICTLLFFAFLFSAGCASLPQITERTPEQTGNVHAAQPSPPILPPENAGFEKIEFIDALGREVQLPLELTCIAPGDLEAQTAIYALKPEALASVHTLPPKGTEAFYKAMPKLRRIRFEAEGFEQNMLADTGAQLLLFMGKPQEKAYLDEIQEKINLPAVYIDASMEALAQAYRSLGSLLGIEDEAEEFALYFETSLQAVENVMAQLPGDKYKSIYYGQGADGLLAAHADSLILAGARNAAEKEIGSIMDAARMANINPDILLFEAGGAYEIITKNSVFSALEQVQLGLYYEIPDMPFDWLSVDANANSILGVKWLCAILYPEMETFQMEDEVKAFFDLFYHISLDGAQAEKLLESSIMKNIG